MEIQLDCDRKGLNMLIESEERLPLSDKELRFLIKTARNAGMQIYPEGNKIQLVIPFSTAAIRRVYANSVNDGRRIMLAKLNEIFYCGAPMKSE